MVMRRIKYLWTCILLLANGALHSSVPNDTIPPVFTIFPSDITVSCSSNTEQEFTNWFMDNAGAEADNGSAEVFATLDLTTALNSLESELTECAGTGSVDFFFYAIDDCDLSSDTVSAQFMVFDLEAPQLMQSPSEPSLICDATTLDSLINWISNGGNSVFSDNCDNQPSLLNYNWTDSNGNSGFGLYSNPIEFTIPRTSCIWSAEFTFFIQDACGNISNTNASFEILGDNEIPELVSFPPDTVLLCHQNMTRIDPVFIDGCDGIIALTFEQTSTQSSSPIECGFYEYSISRTWNGQDACGNTVSYNQNIEVRDTVAPMVVFESIIAKDCSDDLNNVDEFIDYSDNCSVNDVEISDNVLSDVMCSSQIERQYTITDYCGNSRTITQMIQVEDFTPPVYTLTPQNTTHDCESFNLEVEFNNWVNNHGDAVVTDNCSNYELFVSNLDNLNSRAALENAAPANLDPIICQDNVIDNIIFEQEVFFYAIDGCDNIEMVSASFNILDTIPPVIPNCPRDRLIYLDEDQCDQFSALNPPFAIDPCLNLSEMLWDIRVDDVFFFEKTNESIDFNFEIGSHTIEYTLADCAGNVASCVQIVELIDSFPPHIECPGNLEIYLEQDSCHAAVTVPDIKDFSENCFGKDDFTAVQPEGEAFINFVLNTNTNSYSAQSFIIEFDNIDREPNFFKPSITIEYQLNIDFNSRVVLKSELSEDLFVAEKAPCVRQRHKMVIDENQFAIWALDGEINFGVSVEKASGNGILPCNPENLDGPADVDEVSFFKITLEYTDINPDFEIFNESGVSIAQNERNLRLENGNYQVHYRVEDLAGNANECVSEISIIDTLPPTIICSDQEYILTPDTDQFIDILLDDISVTVFDNCEIDRISYFPSEFSCQQINKEVQVVIQAWDTNDNFSFCTSNLTILGAELEPQFVGGLCLADTLKLFANVDDSLNGTFSWTGPRDFRSNDENPIIENISGLNSGTYTLTFVQDQGCTFTGSVDVEVSQFLSPQINSPSSSICVGETLLLNSNSYSENVTYFWYEGISPDGEFIMETQGPSLQVQPALGNNFYYVQVEGQGCLSNPSNTLQIDVLNIPTIELAEEVINVCQGESIQFEVLFPDLDFQYNWSGPNAYISNGPFPAVIDNVSQNNQGIYLVSAENQSCVSETIEIELIVDPLPEEPEIQSNNIFCENETAVLTAFGSANVNQYHWYLNESFYQTTSTQELILPQISSELSGIWTVIAENQNCSSLASEESILIVESQPVIGASSNSPICDGDTVRLTASFIPNSFYEWTDPEGEKYFGREISTLSKSGAYTVSVTTSNGCSAIANTIVEVGETPEITALSNSSFNCMDPGDSFELIPTIFPSGNYDYNWSGPGAFNSDLQRPTILISDNSQAGSYTLTVSNEECTSIPASTTVNYNLYPGNVTIESETLVVCNNDSIIINVSEPIDTIAEEWIWTTPAGQIISATPQLIIPPGSPNMSGSYSVVSKVDDCESVPSNTLDISQINIANSVQLSGPESVCQGEDIILSLPFFENVQYTFVLPDGVIITQASNQYEILNFGIEDIGIYEGRIELDNCQSDFSAPLDIDIELPPSTITFEDSIIDHCLENSSTVEICFETQTQTYDFAYLADAASQSVLTQSNSNCFNLDLGETPVNQSYFLTAFLEENNCRSTFSDTLQLNLYSSNVDPATIDPISTVLCMNQLENISAQSSSQIIEVEWTSEDPNVIFTSPNTLTTNIENLNSGINQIALTSYAGVCGTIGTEQIQFQLLDEIKAEEDIYIFEFTEDIVLAPLFNDIFFSDVVITEVQTSSPLQYNLENELIYVNNTGQLFGQFQIRYTICYKDCPEICDDGIILLNITDSSQCITGNIITPNGDGYNDQFNIPCLDNDFENNQLIIFNQWGDELYRASPYTNDWAGTYQGDPLPAGTYFYYLDLGDGSRPLNGFIVLER